MGYYVNPQNESKENFLNREGIVAPNSPRITWASVPKGFLPVVLLHNSRFSSALIAYCEAELEEATSLEDRRLRTIFMVKIEKLIPEVGPEFEHYVRNQGLI